MWDATRSRMARGSAASRGCHADPRATRLRDRGIGASGLRAKQMVTARCFEAVDGDGTGQIYEDRMPFARKHSEYCAPQFIVVRQLGAEAELGLAFQMIGMKCSPQSRPRRCRLEASVSPCPVSEARCQRAAREVYEGAQVSRWLAKTRRSQADLTGTGSLEWPEFLFLMSQ